MVSPYKQKKYMDSRLRGNDNIILTTDYTDYTDFEPQRREDGLQGAVPV